MNQNLSTQVKTEVKYLSTADIMEPEVRTPTTLPVTVRFKCSKQLMPGQWHHLVIAMAKDIKKSCKVSAYLNGEVIGSSKVGICVTHASLLCAL